MNLNNLGLQNKMPKFQMATTIKTSRNSNVEVVLLIIVMALFYFFLISPKIAARKVEQVKLDQLHTQHDSVASDMTLLKSLSDKLTAHATDLKDLDEALPFQERVIRTQQLFEKLVGLSGVDISDITITSPLADSIVAGNTALLADPYGAQRSLGSIDVNIHVSGTMSQLLDLIKKLENYGRIMDIGSVNMSLIKDNKLDLKLTLTTYYYGVK